MEQNIGYESEKILEENLIKQLIADKYEYVEINDIEDLHNNFRKSFCVGLGNLATIS